jgi:broad specificity phosphatase PhoE
MFEKQNFENAEQIKDYTSKIELIFRRHDEKEKDDTKSDEEVRLTSDGKMHAKNKAEQDDISQSMAFGSSRKRSQETAGLIMSGKLEEITGTETLEELKEKLDKDLSLKSGSKIRTDERLNIEADFTSNYVKKAIEAIKKGEYLKFLVEDSDRLAKEENDDKSSTYTRQFRAIASIVKKYYDIAPRFNELVQDGDKNYEDTMKRFLGSHQGVLESFLAKVIENTKGVEERDNFVKALNNQGFDYAEGFDVDIKNKESGEPTIHLSYKKEKDGKMFFEFDEDVDKEVLLRMTECG